MKRTAHEPVLLNEVLEMLALEENKPLLLVDATLGGGGHAAALLERHPELRLIGFDADPAALERTSVRLAPFASRVLLAQGNFSRLEENIAALPAAELRRLGETGAEELRVDRILADLGISSDQLDDPERGFSFRTDGPLDMRLDPTRGRSAADVLNESSPRQLERMFLRGGVSVPLPRRLAAAIVKERPFETTAQFAALCRRVAPKQFEGPYKDPAVVPFQALRIEVNQEAEAIEAMLPQAFSLLRAGGRLAVISFHSLEDRAVARAMRAWSRAPEGANKLPVRGEFPGAGRHLTAHAIVPGDEEISRNPRSRSARLRVFEKASGGEGEEG